MPAAAESAELVVAASVASCGYGPACCVPGSSGLQDAAGDVTPGYATPLPHSAEFHTPRRPTPPAAQCAAAAPPPPAPPPPPPSAPPVRRVRRISDEYDVHGDLGEGRYSQVRAATCRRTGAARALKVMAKQKEEPTRRAAVELAAHEREILRRVQHPSIISVHEVLETDTHICLVLDKMEGDLYYWVKARKRLTEDDARQIMSRLLSAVAHLHSRGIVHRDIKPENILINSAHDIRVADFGLAKVATAMNTPVGTSFYMAPEVVRGIERDGKPAALRLPDAERVKFIDMWSVGVVLYIVLCGRPPFLGKVGAPSERRELLQQMDRGVLFDGATFGRLWGGVSEDAKDLVLRLLTQDPTRRLTAAEALGHRWFRGSGGDALPSPGVLLSVPRAELAELVDGLRDGVAAALGDGEGPVDDGALLPGAVPPRRKPRPGDLPPRRRRAA